jgi:hypothetical protein
MAKVKEIRNWVQKPKAKRKGVHSKCKASKHKGSKNYLKRNKGQG